MIISFFGIMGAIILALAWIPEILEIIKLKESRLNPKFALSAWIGTFLLLIYSYMIKDFIFIAVNLFILFQVSISLFYEFIVEPKNKKKSKRKSRK